MRTITLFILAAVLLGCRTILNKPQQKFEILTPEQVHNTSEKLLRYNTLKTEFLNTWQKDSNCYKKIQYYLGVWDGPSLEWDDKVKEVQILNILPSYNYDTLVIFTAWFSCEEGNEKEGITVGQPLLAFYSTDKKMQLVCLSADFRVQTHGESAVEKVKGDLYRLMFKGAYLTKENGVDHTFAYRVITDPFIWFDTKEENEQKGLLLRESKVKYFRYLKQKHPLQDFISD